MTVGVSVIHLLSSTWENEIWLSERGSVQQIPDTICFHPDGQSRNSIKPQSRSVFFICLIDLVLSVCYENLKHFLTRDGLVLLLGRSVCMQWCVAVIWRQHTVYQSEETLRKTSWDQVPRTQTRLLVYYRSAIQVGGIPGIQFAGCLPPRSPIGWGCLLSNCVTCGDADCKRQAWIHALLTPERFIVCLMLVFCFVSVFCF